MIGIRTPFRMSFIGGGSDLKEFYSKSPGCVISTTINKYMYIFIHPFFDDRIQIKYSKTELVDSIEQIKHPIVREVLMKFNLQSIDINSIADIPAGTGLGSSSSFTVALLHALHSYTNHHVSPELLARDACEIEIDILKEPIGKQDQYAAAYGGLNIINFLSNGHVNVKPIIIDSKALEIFQSNLVLYFIGSTRKASKILLDQKQNILSDKNKFSALSEMVDLALIAENYLVKFDFEQFGRVLDQNWKLKKSLSKKISPMEIDDIYKLGMKNGAFGGKLLGAGGAGFILFYCEKVYQDKLKSALNKLREIEFKFNDSGSKVIFDDTIK